uniref:Trehalose 6-phosphate phosphatase n=1 Tax=Ananas comosus var. bracteatus TaxID=296719 RepID=A0A6V7QQZ0_ANACO
MTNHNVFTPKDMPLAAAAAVAANATLHYSYPPPRSIGGAADYAGFKKLLTQLEHRSNSGGSSGGWIGSWLDSMRASSPTHVASAAAVLTSPSLMAPCTAEYEEWMKQCPSASNKFEEITAKSKGKKIVMFLDYDGTLSPIVDDPDRAYMSEAMREAVRDVAKCFPTAIVSGRCRDKVFNFVRLAELYYAGSHGMDIRGPTKSPKNIREEKAKAILCQPASEFLPMIEEVERRQGREQQVLFISSLRCVDQKKWDALAEQVKSVLKDYPKLRLTTGRKVLEIRPTIKWDKGKALEFLLESLGYANFSDVFPVYIGDDRTDEDAFKVLRDRGQGIGILVSKVPKDTSASYSLQDPAEVMNFLRNLVEWKLRSLDDRVKV